MDPTYSRDAEAYREKVQAFLADETSGAWERVVDRLLASPHYGERWGRHWLDVAGYADSEGGSPQDPERTNAWKYRDYVIRAFNADKPFDRFVKEQLAGDELVKPPYGDLEGDDLDALIATGFLRMAADGTGAPGADQKLARDAVLTDTVKITASAFLRLTVGCAQCHNHRYDPVPQTDFFRLRGSTSLAYNTEHFLTDESIGKDLTGNGVVDVTDAPYEMGTEDPLAMLDALPGLTAEQRERILGLNALELLSEE